MGSDIMKHHPLRVFLFLAFLLPWGVWGTNIAADHGWIDWHIPAALAFWLGLPVATFGTAAFTGGWQSVRELLLRMIRWRVAPLSYGIALLTVPALASAAALIGFLAGSSAHPQRITVLGLTGALAFNAWMWLLTEEPAWRGFALPRLERHMSTLTAAVLLGVVWALWHVPLWFIPGTFQATLPFTGFLLAAVANSVIIAWLFNRSRRSVLIAALFHAVADVTIAVTGVMTSGPVLLWVFIGVQVAAAAVVASGITERTRRSTWRAA